MSDGAVAVRLPRLTLPELRPVPVLGTIGSHALRAGSSLSNSPFVDRLVRSRLWIALVGVLLIGLVFLNVSLLRLNSEAGKNTELAKALRVQNDTLHARVSRLASGERLERIAAGLGLVMPEAGSVRYLSARSSDASRAARALRAGKRTPGELGSSTATFPLVSTPEPPQPIAPVATAPVPQPTAQHPGTQPDPSQQPAAAPGAPATATPAPTAPAATAPVAPTAPTGGTTTGTP